MALLSSRNLNRLKANNLRFSEFPNKKNIHFFDFKRSDDHTSGEDTTNGSNLCFEYELRRQPEVNINYTAGVLPIQPGLDPAECVIFMYMKSTRMINISSRGIAVTQ